MKKYLNESEDKTMSKLENELHMEEEIDDEYNILMEYPLLYHIVETENNEILETIENFIQTIYDYARDEDV